MIKFAARFEFKIQDFWLGVYWKQRGNGLHIWMCLLPCLPLHIIIPVGTYAACHDCDRPYSDDGFCDLVVPHEIWNNHISPFHHPGGLLCPSCMVGRAEAAGLENIPAKFMSGPFCVEK
jgi:hypothetical protein